MAKISRISGMMSAKSAVILILILATMVLFYSMFNVSLPRSPLSSAPLSHQSSSISYPPPIKLDDPYVPPLRQDTLMVRSGVPINMSTNGSPGEYRQVGFLSKMSSFGEKMILPLMGRNLQNGRDKWQYYTMSNTPGAMSTRLPVSVNGRSATSEYGTDSISNGDMVFVDGYDDTFKTTVYENGTLAYLPNVL